MLVDVRDGDMCLLPSWLGGVSCVMPVLCAVVAANFAYVEISPLLAAAAAVKGMPLLLG
jgi:hypothetical protein